MTIEERLQTDLKDAMRSGDKFRVQVIRSARDALQKARLERVKQQYDAQVAAGEVSETETGSGSSESVHQQITLDAEAQEAVIAKEIKRRRESADIYHKAGRTDRADEEEAEARILEGYLPQQLGADDVRPLIGEVIAELGIHGPSAMGKLMPVLMERFKGRADGRMLSQIARELLQEA